MRELIGKAPFAGNVRQVSDSAMKWKQRGASYRAFEDQQPSVDLFSGLGLPLLPATPGTTQGRDKDEKNFPAVRMPVGDVPIVTVMSRSLSTREASNLLGFSSGTAVLRLIHSGLLRAVKVNGGWVINESDLIDLLRSHPLTDR